MRTPLTPKAAVSGLFLIVASTVHGAGYFSTPTEVTRLPGSATAIKAQAFTEPTALVVLENTSDRPAHCHLNFSTGSVPVASTERDVPPHKRRIERSPGAGLVGKIDVAIDCRLRPA